MAPKDTSQPKSLTPSQFPGASIQQGATHPNSITGAAQQAAAFVGPTLKGPPDGSPASVSSLAEFEATYGEMWDLTAAGRPARNYVALAAKSFFENGGRRLYVARTQNSTRNDPADLTPEDYSRALARLESISEIAVVAAPGGSLMDRANNDSVAPIHSALIADVSRPRAYRFAILDPPPGSSIADLKALRAQIDSSYAAIYSPWVTINNPLPDSISQPQLALPPSGFLCGIYMRSDAEQGVFKAPANQRVAGAIGLERTFTSADADALNSAGIDIIRSFPGKGLLAWGARTVSSDPEWKYVNVRRYILYLERSIDLGTQWAVFETNAETLWQSIRSAISDFLLNEWRRGGLLGSKPEQAFFVKCDRSTMTQNDLDNGRLVCLIGVALLKPAEFVIFRIGQKTASATS